jgi:hypothetical protein
LSQCQKQTSEFGLSVLVHDRWSIVQAVGRVACAECMLSGEAGTSANKSTGHKERSKRFPHCYRPGGMPPLAKKRRNRPALFKSRCQVTLYLPVRNRRKHVWSLWSKIARQIRAALAAHVRLLPGNSGKYTCVSVLSKRCVLSEHCNGETLHANRLQHCSRDMVA